MDDFINPSSDPTNELVTSSHKNMNNCNNCKIVENNIVESDINTTEVIVMIATMILRKEQKKMKRGN